MQCMKFSTGLGCLLIILASVAAAADKATEKKAVLTLEEVIFDASYLKSQLGPKTLLVAGNKSGEITPELPQKLTEEGFAKATRFFLFPSEATPPKLYHSIPHSYPQSMRQGRESGSANFVALVGADGKVQNIYCYQHTDRLFAIAYAAALARWRYEPAKINGTAVPVLVDIPASYKGDGFNSDLFRSNFPPPEALQIPSPPSPQPPSGN